MQAVIIYESLTGTTRRAALAIGDELFANGVPYEVFNVTAVDPQALAAADLVILGTWTDGFVLFGQRPGRKGRIKRLPSLEGKQCVVFCTYAVNPKKTIPRLTKVVESHLGGQVIGGLPIDRQEVDGGAARLVSGVLAALPDAIGNHPHRPVLNPELSPADA